MTIAERFGGSSWDFFPPHLDPRNLDFASRMCEPLQALYFAGQEAAVAESLAGILPGIRRVTCFPLRGVQPRFALVDCGDNAVILLTGTSTLSQAAAQLAGWSPFSLPGGTQVNSAVKAYGDIVYNSCLDQSSDYFNRPILVVGHSFGGGAAAYVCWLFRRDAKPRTNSLFLSYGAPKVGNGTFTDQLGRGGARYFNAGDVVPILPPTAQQAPTAWAALGPAVAAQWLTWEQTQGDGYEVSEGGTVRAGSAARGLSVLQSVSILQWCLDSSSQSGLEHNLGRYTARLAEAFRRQNSVNSSVPAAPPFVPIYSAPEVVRQVAPDATIDTSVTQTIAPDATALAQFLADTAYRLARSVMFLAAPLTNAEGVAIPHNPEVGLKMQGQVPVRWRAYVAKNSANSWNVSIDTDEGRLLARFVSQSRAITFARTFNKMLRQLLGAKLFDLSEFQAGVSEWAQAAASDQTFKPNLVMG